MSEPINELRDILSEARSPVERKLLFLGWLNRRLRERGARRFPILVGGSAVAFYTGGNYSTVDIDLVYDAGDAFNEILASVGFERRGRYWEQDELDLQVDCQGAEAEAPGRVDRIILKNGDAVYISSIKENSIINASRVNAVALPPGEVCAGAGEGADSQGGREHKKPAARANASRRSIPH